MQVFVEIDGRRLALRRLGGDARGRPTLIFLHEGLGSITMWKDFPDELARATGLPALIYDRFGHGRSDQLALPRPPDFLEIEAERLLPELLKKTGIDRPILIGHSDGGTIALLHAAAFPECVVACISEAAHVLFEPAIREALSGVVRRWRQDPGFRRRLARHHRDADRLLEGWAAWWLAPERGDWAMIEKLPRITCPVMVVQGDRDEHGTEIHAEAIMAGVTGLAEKLALKGIGHVPHHEARPAVVAAIARFVASVLAGAGAGGSSDQDCCT
ncbi:MAG: alpha/beta hydrolase [Alphaproteobacteria bacterium]